MNGCQEILEIYSAYIDGEATAAETDLMEKHLADCPNCRSQAEQMRGLSHSLRSNTTDYLRVSSQAMVELVRQQPTAMGRWPPPGRCGPGVWTPGAP